MGTVSTTHPNHILLLAQMLRHGPSQVTLASARSTNELDIEVVFPRTWVHQLVKKFLNTFTSKIANSLRGVGCQDFELADLNAPLWFHLGILICISDFPSLRKWPFNWKVCSLKPNAAIDVENWGGSKQKHKVADWWLAKDDLIFPTKPYQTKPSTFSKLSFLTICFPRPAIGPWYFENVVSDHHITVWMYQCAITNRIEYLCDSPFLCVAKWPMRLL